MYDPLVVDTFTRIHGQGGLITEELSEKSSFTNLMNSALPSHSAIPDVNPLEDITASGEEMLILFELGRNLGDASDLSQVGDIVLRHLRRLVPSSLTVLYLHDQEAAELVASYVSDEHSVVFNGLRIPLGQRLTGWVGAHKQSIRNSDPVLDLGDVARSVTPRLRSCLSAPLVIGQSLVGVLSLYSHGQQAFSEDHQRIVEVIARQISPSLQGITQRRKARGLEAVALAVKEREAPYIDDCNFGVCVIVVTIAAQESDQSPSVDNTENAISKCLRHHLRATDICFRYKRDQYVIIHRPIESGDGELLVRRLRIAIEELSLELRPERRLRGHVTLANMPDVSDSLDELVLAAKRDADQEVARKTNHVGKSPESIH